MAGMRPKGGGLLAVILSVVGVLVLTLICLAALAAAWEYQTNKRAARARSIEVLRQIEEREAKLRARELSSESPESAPNTSPPATTGLPEQTYRD